MALSTNLVSFWKLDESSGNAFDVVGSNNLTNNNTVAFVAAKINNGADFEAGNSESFSITDAAQTGLDITSDISFSMWVNLESTPSSNNQFLFIEKSGGVSPSSYNLLYINDAGTPKIRLNLYDSAAPTVNVPYNWTYTLNTGTWYHLVITWTASTSTAVLYVNGTSQGAVVNASANDINDSTATFYLGTATGGGSYYDGIMDAVGIWSRALIASEAVELYNAGNGTQYPFINTFVMNADTGEYTLTGQSADLFKTNFLNTSRPSSSIANSAKPVTAFVNMTRVRGGYLWSAESYPWLEDSPWDDVYQGLTNMAKPT